MSLFHYKARLADGTEKTGRITAKDATAARKRVAELNPVQQWHWIKAEKDKSAVTPKSTPAFPKPFGAAAKPKPLSKLEKLLYLQSGKCFFCGMALQRDDASIEHIQPKSKGGSDANDNTVACCRTLNQAFGDMELKQKLRIILDKAGSFQCPKR